MALDTSIPLQTQQVNPMGVLSSVLGIQNARNQVQSGQMANQQAGIDLQERQGVQGVLANIKKYQDSAGNVDFNKLAPDIMSVAPTTGSQVLQGVATAQAAATTAHAAVNSLDAASRKTVGDALYSLKGQPPDVVSKTLEGLKTSFPGLGSAVDYMGNYILAPHASDPTALDNALDTAGKFVQTAPTTQSMSTPEGVVVNDGATSKVVSVKPGTTVAQGKPVPGTLATLRPGPTQATIGPDGQPGIVGAQQADFSGLQGPGRTAALADIASRDPDGQNRQEAANALAGRPQGFVPTGMAPGQAQNIANNVDEMGKHFAGLQDQASGAQLVAGLTGNIKALATTAATGTGGDKKAYVDGLLTALHIPGATGDLQKDTDLLEKNMAQLNLGTPASSDAARALVQAARPHSSMNAAAISEAADQVAAQVQANMAMRNMLAPAKMMGDVATYNAQRQKLEQVADPRAWQYVNLGPGSAAAKEFMSKLQPADRQTLIQKVDQLEQMGMLK
jgi:hypothetical protein